MHTSQKKLLLDALLGLRRSGIGMVRTPTERFGETESVAAAAGRAATGKVVAK